MEILWNHWVDLQRNKFKPGLIFIKVKQSDVIEREIKVGPPKVKRQKESKVNKLVSDYVEVSSPDAQNEEEEEAEEISDNGGEGEHAGGEKGKKGGKGKAAKKGEQGRKDDAAVSNADGDATDGDAVKRKKKGESVKAPKKGEQGRKGPAAVSNSDGNATDEEDVVKDKKKEKKGKAAKKGEPDRKGPAAKTGSKLAKGWAMVSDDKDSEDAGDDRPVPGADTEASEIAPEPTTAFGNSETHEERTKFLLSLSTNERYRETVREAGKLTVSWKYTFHSV